MAEAGFGMLTCHGAEMCEHLLCAMAWGEDCGWENPCTRRWWRSHLQLGAGSRSLTRALHAQKFPFYTVVCGEARLMRRWDLGRKAYSV